MHARPLACSWASRRRWLKASFRLAPPRRISLRCSSQRNPQRPCRPIPLAQTPLRLLPQVCQARPRRTDHRRRTNHLRQPLRLTNTSQTTLPINQNFVSQRNTNLSINLCHTQGSCRTSHSAHYYTDCIACLSTTIASLYDRSVLTGISRYIYRIGSQSLRHRHRGVNDSGDGHESSVGPRRWEFY